MKTSIAAVVAGVVVLIGIGTPTYDQIYNHWWIATVAALAIGLALVGGGLVGAALKIREMCKCGGS